jgi:hypothetical protein
MDNMNSTDNRELDLDNGHSRALMDEICKRYSERRGAQQNTSFNLEEFLNNQFSGTSPHITLKENISKLVDDGFLTQEDKNIDLAKRGIEFCRKKTNGFIY